MPIPNADSLMDIARNFYLLWDIPHCTGALDVRQIRIKNAAHAGTLYFNYKKFYAIALQALADARYKFITIHVGGFGSQHDATTLRFSSLYRAN